MNCNNLMSVKDTEDVRKGFKNMVLKAPPNIPIFPMKQTLCTLFFCTFYQENNKYYQSPGKCCSKRWLAWQQIFHPKLSHGERQQSTILEERKQAFSC